MYSKVKIKIIFSVIVFQFLIVFPVMAVGVGVKPSHLDLDVQKGKEYVGKIIIYNVSKEPAVFKIYPDELVEWIEVKPNDFRLEATENKEIEIIIKAKDDGRHATNLSVVASPLDKRQFNADSGVKIPIRLNVTKTTNKIFNNLYLFMGLWMLVSIILICLVVIIVLKLRKRTFKEKVLDRVDDIIHPNKHWWE